MLDRPQPNRVQESKLANFKIGDKVEVISDDCGMVEPDLKLRWL